MPEMPSERKAQRAARAVYGAIIALAVVVVLEETSASAIEVVVSAVGAVVAAMLAEGYAEYIASVIREHRHLARSEFVDSSLDIAAGGLAALVPVVPFVLAAVDAIELETAYDIAPWIGLGVIGGYTLFANREAGLGRTQTILLTAGGVLIGLSLIALKAATH
jgi:hypothetical protein